MDKSTETGAGKTRRITPLSASRQEDAAVNAAAMTPLLPVRIEDAIAAARSLVKQATATPVNLVSMVSGLAGDCLDILKGQSPLTPPPKSRRFKDERWAEHWYYRSTLQAWLALDKRTREWLKTTDLSEAEKRRAKFFLNLWLGSLSPANFPVTNPEVVDETVKTGGQNLLSGFLRRWDDYMDNASLPTQVDKKHFQLGKNLAVTPGEVIYRNEMIELIQYRPKTAKVYSTPLLLVSSTINRGYIFDLKPGRSFVDNMLDEGYQVFVIIWRNPTREHSHWGHDDYVQAVIDAGEVVRKVRRVEGFNLMGLCAGGMIATLAAYALASQNKDWVKHLTLAVNVLDSRPQDSEMGLMCTPEAVALAKQQAKMDGIFRADDLLWVFNLMQPENLIWNTSVDYYLLGKEPSTSEVMFWMNDQTNLAAKFYNEQLDNMLHNLLATGQFKLFGEEVDLTQLTTESYILGAYYDHIMPWHAVYRSRKLLGGNTEFVLTNGGHITPCITAVDNPKSKFYTNPTAPEDHEEWLQDTEEHNGSWQSHWAVWLQTRSGKQVNAPKKLGNSQYPSLGDAPGSYVFK